MFFTLGDEDFILHQIHLFNGAVNGRRDAQDIRENESALFRFNRGDVFRKDLALFIVYLEVFE